MSRTSHSVSRRKRVKKTLKLAKGARFKRSKNYRRASETVKRALVYSYRDRRVRKREFRKLWITRLNAAVREKGIKYSEFIDGLRKNNIELSRDILANLAIEEPGAFEQIVEIAKIRPQTSDNRPSGG